MHVVVAIFYALIIWACLLLLAAMLHGNVLAVVLFCPLIVSGLAMVFMVLGHLAGIVWRWLWRSRATWRS